MLPPDRAILVLNGGSSTVRFAVQRADAALTRLRRGKIAGVGRTEPCIRVEEEGGRRVDRRILLDAHDHEQAIAALLGWLEGEPDLPRIGAVGHRLVHGMQHFDPEQVTDALLDDLRRNLPIDPDHLPVELAMILAMRRLRPDWPQVACFDTLFHRDLPRVAAMLPIPRRWAAQGLRRYGFHGLSYTWLMEALDKTGDPSAGDGRVILAHLGGGASLAAVRRGRCIDTTMSFTPTAGLVMGTRSGDLDPSLGPYLERTAGMTGEQFMKMVNHESGLLGLSETSSDMRELLDKSSHDQRAAEAVEMFCYQARKGIGSLAAALGGIDTLVFSGGIGQSAAPVRERICDGLQFLGVKVDRARNQANDGLISAATGRVAVRVIPTDEEHVIARSVRDTLSNPSTGVSA